MNSERCQIVVDELANPLTLLVRSGYLIPPLTEMIVAQKCINILIIPWRIGTLKYLEIKVEEWPSRAKWGQLGPNGAK